MGKFSIKLTLLIFAFYIVHFTLYISPAYAEGADIGYSRITPASSFYFLKAARENWELRFAGTPKAKLELNLNFSFRRLREARTLVSQNQVLIAPTLERYMEEINSLPDKDNEKEFGLRVTQTLNMHLAVLEQMHLQVSSLGAKMAIRAAIDRIIQRADVSNEAREPICLLFSKEASSSALNSTEKVVLAKRAENCFKRLKP